MDSTHLRAGFGEGDNSREPARLHFLPDQPTGLLQWSDSITGKGRAMDIIYLDFLKDFYVVHSNIFCSKLDLMGGLFSG